MMNERVDVGDKLRHVGTDSFRFALRRLTYVNDQFGEKVRTG